MENQSEEPDHSKTLAAFYLSTGFSSGSTFNFKEMLIREISRLLDQSPERMWQIFYRLDVSEAKVQTVFKFMSKAEWPEALAGLIIEREKYRLELRKKYGSGSTTPFEQ